MEAIFGLGAFIVMFGMWVVLPRVIRGEHDN